MAWFDEIPHLFRRPIAEIGFAFYVREKMKNDLTADAEDLRLTIGQDWERVLDGLRRDGIMKVSHDGRRYRLMVTAPGDKKRARCRDIGRRKRLVKKGNHNEEVNKN